MTSRNPHSNEGTTTVDPYVYEGTDVLVNRFGIRSDAALERVERSMTEHAIRKLLQADPPEEFGFGYLRDVHRKLFGRIYPFAGELRTVEMRKPDAVLSGRSVGYARPDRIEEEADAAIRLMHVAVADGVGWGKLALSVAGLWRAHPFREGNTRAVFVYLHQFARAHGFPLDADVTSRDPGKTRDALALAATGVEEPLSDLLRDSFRSYRTRRHPVLGFVSAHAAEILARHSNLPLAVAEPGDRVRGQVACVTGNQVIVLTSKGLLAVREELLPHVPADGEMIAAHALDPEAAAPAMPLAM